jgi:hypothetical protein
VQIRADARSGSVTFAQRFGSALNLNPHFHVLFLDGVYVDNGGKPNFLPAPNLTDDDVKKIVETTAQRVIRLLTKHLVRRPAVALRAMARFWTSKIDNPPKPRRRRANVRGMVATGDRAGFRVRRVLSDPEDAVRTGDFCFASRGFSLHAFVVVRRRASRYGEMFDLERPRSRRSLGVGGPLAAGRLTRVSRH